ncbi:hypothetical protein A2774_03090 [Candidatus Roizmanbacteria bacterium RIFCSPHIGHO2_01_FULL_39_12c]|uniref:D,D-heptose 1,7-bisphosphate phosphatase n=1 Tax=Candidatus Roizmanbacteria bacterium RIFCSPHIGHO2_01_FULL_39_12c TaxID=1802031 RepID=A0A1F7GC13_9BACT|nr:MAG: hypothetical protein A2774_03090 [Candidatus Roizmanbacteria bacterium RIFCSPHIGHO2_01_FULL_39_12c]OGK47415.1 MAG: hypothetical protein A2963_04650 [Candidatus Roizmanbacteria bacterium RIFCSPLOWO2_01_FULL_40_13]
MDDKPKKEKKRKAVFLDRDGIINKEVDNLRNINQIRLLPHVAKAIKKFKRNGYLVIVITNQPVVARGWISESELEEINQELLRRLKNKGAIIDAVYYCPHHPKANLPKYRKDCSDRKPNISLIIKAVQDFNISLKRSYFIGDSTTDLQTAFNAHIRSILVLTGYKGNDGRFNAKPDKVVADLLQASNVV